MKKKFKCWLNGSVKSDIRGSSSVICFHMKQYLHRQEPFFRFTWSMLPWSSIMIEIGCSAKQVVKPAAKATFPDFLLNNRLYDDSSVQLNAGFPTQEGGVMKYSLYCLKEMCFNYPCSNTTLLKYLERELT